MSKTEIIETLTEQLNKVTAERDAWKMAAEKNEQRAIEESGRLIDLLHVAFSDLLKYGRCNVCKYYQAQDDICRVGKPCDGKKEWKWRGLQK